MSLLRVVGLKGATASELNSSTCQKQEPSRELVALGGAQGPFRTCPNCFHYNLSYHIVRCQCDKKRNKISVDIDLGSAACGVHGLKPANRELKS